MKPTKVLPEIRKMRFEEAELVLKAKKRSAHRKRREHSTPPSMMIHQGG